MPCSKQSRPNASLSAKRCASRSRRMRRPVRVWPPPTIRPEGLVQTLAVFRTLSRMVKDAARMETPFLRVFDACYGYLLKYNTPVSKALPSPVGPVPAVSKPEVPSDHWGRTNPERKAAPRPVERVRSPRVSQQKRHAKSRRSRSPRRRGPPSAAEGSEEKSLRDARLNAWVAG